MRILFLDTEFTAPGPNAEILSIGLVSDDGVDQFYVELNDVSGLHCSAFVLAEVLPHFGRFPEAMCDLAEMRIRVRRFLESFAPFVRLASDLEKDWTLLMQLVGDPWPTNVDRVRLRLEHIDGLSVQVEKHSSGRDRHHALTDAQVIRLAYLDLQSKR